MVAPRFSFLKAMLEGPLRWSEIIAYFIEKEHKNHIQTNIRAYGSHWHSGRKLNVWVGH